MRRLIQQPALVLGSNSSEWTSPVGRSRPGSSDASTPYIAKAATRARPWRPRWSSCARCRDGGRRAYGTEPIVRTLNALDDATPRETCLESGFEMLGLYSHEKALNRGTTRGRGIGGRGLHVQVEDERIIWIDAAARIRVDIQQEGAGFQHCVDCLWGGPLLHGLRNNIRRGVDQVQIVVCRQVRQIRVYLCERQVHLEGIHALGARSLDEACCSRSSRHDARILR